jgi:cyanophycinase
MGAPPGHLLVIGGHEDRTGDRRILRRFVALAGGREARLAVLATASEDGAAAAQAYRAVFSDLGVGHCEALPLERRREAFRPGVVHLLERSTGIFFTGGDQLRITAVLGGTAAEEALFRAHRRGAAVAGTSAGAAVMSSTMIVGGHGEEPPRLAAVRMSPGLGLWPGVVIDPHFAQRGRLNRLLVALAQNPGLLGVGIDEDTAVWVRPSGRLSVVGSQSVTLLDGRRVVASGATETGPKGPIPVTGVVLHVLVPGNTLRLGRLPLAIGRIAGPSLRQPTGEIPVRGRGGTFLLRSGPHGAQQRRGGIR